MASVNPLTRWIYDHSPAQARGWLLSLYSRQRGERKFGPKFREHLADLQRTQWYSQAELRALQDEKIRRILWQAGRFVPYYRDRFKELGVVPRDIRNREDLRALPILEKPTVQAHATGFRSELYLDATSAEVIHTSGTTGKAIDVVVANDYLKLEKSFLWLQRDWCGAKPGDRTAYFTGHPVVPMRQRRPPFWVYDQAENRMFFSLQHLSKDNFKDYAAALARFDPILLVGYPTAIYLLAVFLCDSGERAPRPCGIFTASETLLPHQRQMMETAFGCKVMDLYGQAEYCGMVMQCDHGSYHTQEEYGLVEILSNSGQPAGSGEIGEIVCTGLNNLAMPFLRYRTGDTAVPGAELCPCGRGGALLERITGRMEDIIVTPDGRYLSRLDFIFKEMPFIREAQLVQESKEHLQVRIVPRGSLSEAERNHLFARLKDRIGEKVHFELEILDAIPRLPNGKFRYVISKVPLDLGGTHQTGELLKLHAQEEKLL